MQRFLELKAVPEPGENLLADRMYFWEKFVWQSKEKLVERKMIYDETIEFLADNDINIASGF